MKYKILEIRKRNAIAQFYDGRQYKVKIEPQSSKDQKPIWINVNVSSFDRTEDSIRKSIISQIKDVVNPKETIIKDLIDEEIEV